MSTTKQKFSLSGAIESKRSLFVQPDGRSAQKDRDCAGSGVPDKFILSVLLMAELDSPSSDQRSNNKEGLVEQVFSVGMW